MKAIVFDFGGTIVVEKPFIYAAQMGAVRYVKNTLHLFNPEEELYKKLRNTPHLPSGHPLLREVKDREYYDRRQWLIDFARSCGMEGEDDSLGNTLLQAYDNAAKRSNTLDKKTVMTLRNLKQEGYMLYILSNGYAGFVHATIDFYDIRKCFRKIIVSQEVNVEKPDPKIFYLTIDDCRIQPCEAMMVGDSYTADIQGAKGIGMKTCWVNVENDPPPGNEHDFIIENVAQLPGVL